VSLSPHAERRLRPNVSPCKIQRPSWRPHCGPAVRRRSWWTRASGLRISIVCIWSLLTLLVPDRFASDYAGSGNRLSATPLATELARHVRRGRRAARRVPCAGVGESPVARATSPPPRAPAPDPLYSPTALLLAWFCPRLWPHLCACRCNTGASGSRLRSRVLGRPGRRLSVWRSSSALSLTIATPSICAVLFSPSRFFFVLAAPSLAHLAALPPAPRGTR